MQMAGPRRARRLDENGALKAVWIVADDVGRRIDRAMDEELELIAAAEQPSEEWLRRLWRESNNIVQFSEPTPVSAENAKEAVDFIFHRLVVDPESIELNYSRKSTAVSAIRTAYANLGLKRHDQFLEHFTVQARHYREDFDFVVANGKAIQLTQAWSFQIPNQRDLAELVKAYAFTVRDLRQTGGLAIKGDRRIEIPANVDVAAVCIPPREGSPTTAFDVARSAFDDREVRIRLVPVANVVTDVARPAQESLLASS